MIMKRYIPVLVVFVLVLAAIGIAWKNPVWASPKSAAGDNSPSKTTLDIASDGTYNVGGVCEIVVDLKTQGNELKADAEVPITESVVVPFTGDSNLLFPGCHFVFYKGAIIASPVSTDDATLKVCFGASQELQMGIYYYLDNAGTAGRAWTLLPSTLEDAGRLICAPVLYAGVYMPAGKVVPPTSAEQVAANPFFENGRCGTGRCGTVQPPDPEITITESGIYAVGGVCLITTNYIASGLADTVQVEYPTKHYTADTLTVPFSNYVNDDLFFFPGCHVIHYKDQIIQNQVNITDPKDGDWRICFAAIPDKTMTIYYYDDNLKKINAPWTALETTTENGMACADLVDFSAVYAPAGK
jgi:hypothetical protein